MERRKSVNEIKEVAINACKGINFDAEKSAEVHLDSLEKELQQFLSQIPSEMRDDLEKEYISKYKEWLHALGRCVSPMIAGASKFNHRRHEKQINAEQNARKRLDEWSAKIIKRVNRKEKLVGWAEVERLTLKLERLQRVQELMKSANKIVRNAKKSDEEKIDELVALGMSAELAQKVNAEPQYSFEKKGYQSYHLSNNLAKIKATEKALKEHTAMAESEDSETEYDWGTLQMCYTDERIRFIFDSIPDDDVRQLLKSNAFKWSPTNQAWQRQLTTSAKFAMNRILEYLNK